MAAVPLPIAVRRFSWMVATWLAVPMAGAQPVHSSSELRTLKQLSIDELVEVEVTSVSRRAEPYGHAAAALSVITADDIRHSPATTLPDLLRVVPGLHVARQTSNNWAVSARGFSSISSEKLLVQTDTRSIYTPLFSGVFWDVQDYLLADIERIEVIRGPGAALWGSNAVNGVINLTTKHAKDTHGTLVEASAGTEERAMVAARHGGETRGGIHYRVFAKYVERDDSFHATVSDDAWRQGHVGFRTDWISRSRDEFTVQGDAYRGVIGKLVPAVNVIGRPGPTGDLETTVSGGNLLGRWRRKHSAASELQLRTYYDWTRRNDPSFTDDLDTIDLDLQHRFVPRERHELMWGLNYRYTSNRNEGKGIFEVRPGRSRDQLVSAFVQDQIDWRGVRLTLGTKAEHNDFSGFELQPSARAAWNVSPRHTLWVAVSRAARIPTRLERDIFITVSNPAGNPVARLLGDRDFEAERVVAYELGHRWHAAQGVHVDLAVFENQYRGLSSLEVGTAFVDPADGRTIVPIVNRNLTSGRARGVETQLSLSPVEGWRVTAGHAFLSMTLHPAGADLNRGDFYEGATPRHQFHLASCMSLPGGVELDLFFRRIGKIRRIPPVPVPEGLPGYHELDAQISWQASPRLRISLVGQNLMHRRHYEFGAPDARGALERGVYLKAALTWPGR